MAAGRGRRAQLHDDGPLLLLDVDGHLPGTLSTTPDKQPKRVRARLRVRSETAPVTNVQLIVNGRVVRELVVPRETGTAQWLSLDETIELTESSWIAARAFSKSPFGTADAEAHTNPVFVNLGRKAPVHAADIDWLIGKAGRTDRRSRSPQGPGKAAGDRLLPPLPRDSGHERSNFWRENRSAAARIGC